MAGLVTVLCLAGVAVLPSGAALTLTVVFAMMTGWLLRQKMATAGWFLRIRRIRSRARRRAKPRSSGH